jgi:2-dehydropantoate 2-reductase
MKYAVIGLGAVGSIVGGLLARSGEDVLLIGKKTQVQAINKNGLRIDGFEKKPILLKNVKTSSDFSLLEDVDVIFICVKSQDTEELAIKIREHLKESAVLISLQNGVRNKETIENITKTKTLSGIVLFNAFYSKPGYVTFSLKGAVLIEDDDSVNPDVFISLKKSGLKIDTAKNFRGFLYSKLIVNLQIAVTALTDQTIRESIIDNITRKILVATMSEGIEIVENSGIVLEKLPEIDPKKMVKTLSRFGSITLRIGSRLTGLNDTARNSMWQSLARGKPTEIDYINGEIVKLAKNNGLAAPINSKLVELVKEAEKKHLTKSFEPAELKEILKL